MMRMRCEVTRGHQRSPVSLVVTRDDVQQHEVAAPVRNVAEADPHSREHSSGFVYPVIIK